ncbi:MAG: pectate lyase [Duncaniella sp.]|nr:pectate lyase [Duncaniella sp.]
MKLICKFLSIVAVVGLCVATAVAAPKSKQRNLLRKTDKEFFKTELADKIGRQVVAYQRCTGGWPKNINMSVMLSPSQMDSVLAVKSRRDDSTIDNNATTEQMTYLARLYQATGDTLYLNSFRRGVEFLLSGQYPNGGWPQFWPENWGYQVHITYNDGAMVNTMLILREISAGVEPYQNMVDKETALRIDDAFARGVDCILATQIIGADGRRTVWCQQHDHETLAPAKARSYELPSYCSQESVGIVELLMSLPEPNAGVREAIHGAMRWLDDHKLVGYKYGPQMIDGKPERVLVEDATASTPLWARFYDLDNAEPFVSDRDGVPVRSVMEIGSERRNGYGWYNDAATRLYPQYEAWCERYSEPKEKF